MGNLQGRRHAYNTLERYFQIPNSHSYNWAKHSLQKCAR